VSLSFKTFGTSLISWSVVRGGNLLPIGYLSGPYLSRKGGGWIAKIQ